MARFHHEEGAVHNIWLSRKGDLSGVTAGVTVIQSGSFLLLCYYIIHPGASAGSSHDPLADEPEEGSSQLICKLRKGDLVVLIL